MRFLIRLPSLSNSLSLASPIIKHDWSLQTCTLREMMKNSAGEVEIVCPHCFRSCLHYDEHECARIATRWLTPNSYWLVIIEGPINQLNRSSWLATFDTSPNMSIVLQPTPFKFRGENSHSHSLAGPQRISYQHAKWELGILKQYGCTSSFFRFRRCRSSSQLCKSVPCLTLSKSDASEY